MCIRDSPIYDRWAGKVDVRKIQGSNILWSLCNGLRIDMEEYRRGVDRALFDYYFDLRAGNVDGGDCTVKVDEACQRWALKDEALAPTSVFLCLQLSEPSLGAGGVRSTLLAQ